MEVYNPITSIYDITADKIEHNPQFQPAITSVALFSLISILDKYSDRIQINPDDYKALFVTLMVISLAGGFLIKDLPKENQQHETYNDFITYISKNHNVGGELFAFAEEKLDEKNDKSVEFSFFFLPVNYDQIWIDDDVTSYNKSVPLTKIPKDRRFDPKSELTNMLNSSEYLERDDVEVKVFKQRRFMRRPGYYGKNPENYYTLDELNRFFDTKVVFQSEDQIS